MGLGFHTNIAAETRMRVSRLEHCRCFATVFGENKVQECESRQFPVLQSSLQIKVKISQRLHAFIICESGLNESGKYI